MNDSEPPKPERSRYRVSVGTLLVAMLVLPVALLLILGPLGCGDKPAQAPNRAKQAPSTEATSRERLFRIGSLLADGQRTTIIVENSASRCHL